MKVFNIQHNIGKAKYVVNFSNGQQKNRDGSPFFDIRIFKNKIILNHFVKYLLMNGYINK